MMTSWYVAGFCSLLLLCVGTIVWIPVFLKWHNREAKEEPEPKYTDKKDTIIFREQEYEQEFTPYHTVEEIYNVIWQGKAYCNITYDMLIHEGVIYTRMGVAGRSWWATSPEGAIQKMEMIVNINKSFNPKTTPEDSVLLGKLIEQRGV